MAKEHTKALQDTQSEPENEDGILHRGRMGKRWLVVAVLAVVVAVLAAVIAAASAGQHAAEEATTDPAHIYEGSFGEEKLTVTVGEHDLTAVRTESANVGFRFLEGEGGRKLIEVDIGDAHLTGLVPYGSVTMEVTANALRFPNGSDKELARQEDGSYLLMSPTGRPYVRLTFLPDFTCNVELYHIYHLEYTPGQENQTVRLSYTERLENSVDWGQFECVIGLNEGVASYQWIEDGQLVEEDVFDYAISNSGLDFYNYNAFSVAPCSLIIDDDQIEIYWKNEFYRLTVNSAEEPATVYQLTGDLGENYPAGTTVMRRGDSFSVRALTYIVTSDYTRDAKGGVTLPGGIFNTDVPVTLEQEPLMGCWTDRRFVSLVEDEGTGIWYGSMDGFHYAIRLREDGQCDWYEWEDMTFEYRALKEGSLVLTYRGDQLEGALYTGKNTLYRLVAAGQCQYTYPNNYANGYARTKLEKQYIHLDGFTRYTDYVKLHDDIQLSDAEKEKRHTLPEMADGIYLNPNMPVYLLLLPDDDNYLLFESSYGEAPVLSLDGSTVTVKQNNIIRTMTLDGNTIRYAEEVEPTQAPTEVPTEVPFTVETVLGTWVNEKTGKVVFTLYEDKTADYAGHRGPNSAACPFRMIDGWIVIEHNDYEDASDSFYWTSDGKFKDASRRNTYVKQKDEPQE